MIALDPGAAGAFLRRLGPALDRVFGRPGVIVAVSAHTTARAPVLLGASRHEAVHDFGNFDPRLFEMRYDAPGAPQWVERVDAALRSAGVSAHTSADGGLDHGLWTVLRYLYPDADVPVLPLAFAPGQSPAEQFALGAALAPLARDGAWILGSGSITHNLRRALAGGLRAPPNQPEIEPCAAFRAWMAERSAARDWSALLEYRHRAPYAQDMHPTDEHLLPWYVAAGAGGTGAAPVRLHASVTLGSLGMDAYAFGASAAALMADLALPIGAAQEHACGT